MTNETTHVYLEGNRITSILSSSLSTLTNTVLLDLGKNLLTDVEDGSFAGLRITHMDLSYNQLTYVPDLAALASTLSLLDLRSNAITAIEPYAFTNFTALNRIYFSANSITSLPDFALHKPRAGLYHLYINGNSLAVLGNRAFEEISVSYLVLDDNALEEIPCLQNTRRVTYLYLRKNPITTIPSGCGQWWNSLKILHLEQTRLTSLDGITKYTPNLLRLRVDGSPITLSDETFKETHVLTDVIMRDVNLFPRFHSSKSSLVRLELGGKSISCIEEAWLDGMNKVTRFVLGSISIELLPHNGCSNNSYENNTGLGYFLSLHTMVVNNGKLIHLPNLTALGHNSSLTFLQLRDNRIPSVPCFPDTFKLNNLERLDLLNNQIDYICNLDFVPNIQYLLLSGNALVDIMFIESTNEPLLYLQYIQIESVTIDSLSDSVLRVFPNIGNLRMGANNIEVFPNIRLIAGGAEYIALHQNLIPDVPCTALDRMDKLISINLEANMITYVCPTILSLTPKLTTLNLKNNKLLELADLRVPVRLQPTSVQLIGNPLRCLTAMCWMLFVPQASQLQLGLSTTTCVDSEDKGKTMIVGLTEECTCKSVDGC